MFCQVRSEYYCPPFANWNIDQFVIFLQTHETAEIMDIYVID